MVGVGVFFFGLRGVEGGFLFFLRILVFGGGKRNHLSSHPLPQLKINFPQSFAILSKKDKTAIYPNMAVLFFYPHFEFFGEFVISCFFFFLVFGMEFFFFFFRFDMGGLCFRNAFC